MDTDTETPSGATCTDLTSVAHGDIVSHLTGFMCARDVCSLFSVDKRMQSSVDSIDARNSIWMNLYRRDFPSMDTSELSRHKEHVVCDHKDTCKRVRHYTHLVVRTTKFIQFKNYFRQYVSRTLTKVRRIQSHRFNRDKVRAQRAVDDVRRAIRLRGIQINDIMRRVIELRQSRIKLTNDLQSRLCALNTMYNDDARQQFAVAMDWMGRRKRDSTDTRDRVCEPTAPSSKRRKQQ